MVEHACPRCGVFHPATRPCTALTLAPRWTESAPVARAPLAGRYTLIRPIHRGGMSIVYLAEDAVTRTPLVAKELRLAPDLDPKERQEAQTWFLREATLLGTLAHPLIPRFHRALDAEGRRFLLQDYVRGETLEQYADTHGAIDEKQALDWGRALCELLLYLHGQPAPIIFRDLKPANILLRPDGRLAVIDFGIARPYRPRQVNTVIGTPGYAPPEQYQGLASPLSDVYALGATLHRLLTGVNPESGPPFTFAPIRERNPQISHRLATLIAATLNPRPADRPSMERLAAGLQSIAEINAGGQAMVWPPRAHLGALVTCRRYLLGAGLAMAPLVLETIFGALHFSAVIWATVVLLLLAEGSAFLAALCGLWGSRTRWVGLGVLSVQALLLYGLLTLTIVLL